MDEVIRRIHIPERSRTGIVEERDRFAQTAQSLVRRRARHRRVLTALGFRRRSAGRKDR